MNERELMLQRKRVYNSYHISGCSNLHRVKKNAVFLSVANSLEHELAKCNVCYELKKRGYEFLTEAVDNKSGLRRDIVSLDDGRVYEVETDERRAKRFDGDSNVVVIKLWEAKK